MHELTASMEEHGMSDQPGQPTLRDQSAQRLSVIARRDGWMVIDPFPTDGLLHVPDGLVLVHGERGGIWLIAASVAIGMVEPCDCGWHPEIGQHYRARAARPTGTA